MRVNFYARVRKCQNMKHQKRENTGSIVLIIEMNIIIIIIIIMRIMFFRNKNYIYVQSPERRPTYYFGRWADEKVTCPLKYLAKGSKSPYWVERY